MEQERIEDSENRVEHFKTHGFYIDQSKYYVIRYHKGNQKETHEEISNFVGKSIFNIDDGTNNSTRIILLQRSNGGTSFIEVKSAELKPDAFDSILKSKQSTFYGSSTTLKRIIAQWMDDEKTAFKVNNLGRNQEHNIFAFSNAIYNYAHKDIVMADQMGVVKVDKDYYFLEASSKWNTNNNDYENEKKFKYVEGKLNFEQWSRLFYDTYGMNGAIGIQFLILTLYRNIIFDQIGFFPYLFLFGSYGTGKTTMTESLLRPFGNDIKGIPLSNSTKVGLSRTIARRHNTIVYLKEYTKDIDKMIQDIILSGYDGTGRSTGVKSNDNKTHNPTIKSSSILDGNHLPSMNSAILSRTILLMFDDNKFTQKQRDTYERLKREERIGLGKIIVDILDNSQTFSSKFREVFECILKELHGAFHSEMAERTIKHTALLLTPMKLLQGKLVFPFEYEDMKTQIIENSKEQTQTLNQTNELNIFWQAFSDNKSNYKLVSYSKHVNNKSTSHYNIKSSNGQDILQIKLAKVYAEYVKYCKAIDMQFIESNTLRKLLTRPSYAPFIPTTQKNRGSSYTDADFGSCYQFALSKENGSFHIDGVEIPT